jgi:hypothetical protein
MQEHEQEIRYVVAMVWESMLQTVLEPRERWVDTGGPAYVSEVTIAGSWNGAILLAVSEAEAGAAAGRMFGLPQEQITPRHRGDAVNELANVVAGNLKPMLGGHCCLGIPRLTTDLSNDGEGGAFVLESRLSFQAMGEVAQTGDGAEVGGGAGGMSPGGGVEVRVLRMAGELAGSEPMAKAS